MRMTSRDKELIVLALSLGIVAASWFVGAKQINKKSDEMELQKTELQNEYDERIRILEKKDEYLADTKNYNDAYVMMMNSYPEGISQVKQIMFVTGLEERFNTQVVSVSYTDEQPVYSFQTTEPKNMAPYSLTRADIQIPVTLSYRDWKDFLDYVYSYQDKSTVPQVSAAFEPLSGMVSATVTMNQYAVTGEGRTLTEPEITVPIGTDNIFTSGAALSYDGGKAEQMEAIKKKHDFYLMLYPAASDVSAKVIAGFDESEKIISASNEEEKLTIVAQDQEDGTVSVTYTLGDKKPGVLYGLSGETIDVYVLSTPRMGGTDLSGVNVIIENRTSKKMRIAVAGEDSAKPRFAVQTQDGNVEILK